ncbi:Uncharacterised protein [Corynebacterium ulcerans]|nr:Uncharacterised protein [Corynebacterium ulcerans]
MLVRVRGDKDKELIVTLSLGAGLLNAEILALTWEDVAIDEVGAVIRAGDPARSIPVRAEHDAALRTGGTGLVGASQRVCPLSKIHVA